MEEEQYAGGEYAAVVEENRPGSEMAYAEVKDDGSGRIQSVMSEGTSPGVQQAVSPKDQKKLDKEAKAREKKEKQETKRKLKDEERKIREEAKKKVETPAEKRRRQRQERLQQEAGGRGNRTVLGFLSPMRPGVQPKNMRPCKVHLLDGTDYDFELEPSAKGRLLVEMVCERVNLLEKDYFSCSYNDEDGVKYWIIPDRRIAKQIGTRDWVFDFGVKFYVPEPNVLQEEITRYQLCLQLQANIVSGKLPCSMVTAALLGAYMVQSELGDYDVREFGHGVDYLRDFKFSPEQSHELLSKVHEIHCTLTDQSPAEADLNYLSNATKMELYGVELQDAMDAELIQIKVGVCSSGLIVYRDNIRINHFPWPLVLKMSYKKNNFNVKIRPAAGEQFITMLTFKMPNRRLTKRFWRLAAEIHTFFRLKSAIPLDRGVFARFGASKHRFSGRTYYQSHTWASTVTRPQPYFERTGSRMTTSATTSSFIDEREKAARRKQLEAEGGGEVSVLAGSGADPAGRVAYVRTVQPETDVQPGIQPGAHLGIQPGVHSGIQPGTDSAKRGAVTSPPGGDVSSDVTATSHQHTIVVSADINTRAAGEVDDEKQKKKKKTKKTKTATSVTTTTTTTQNAYSDDEGNVVVTSRSVTATERSGPGVTVENDVERRQVTGRQDVDHDYELSRAINNVMAMDADLSVDKIEINPSEVAATMSARQDPIQIAPVKKPKPKPKPSA